MKRYIAMILVLCGSSMGLPGGVHADGECTPNKLLKESFKEAAVVEKSGNLPLAFSAFQFAEQKSGCEGPNPSWQEAAAGWKRTGQRLAKEAEAKGTFHAYGKTESVTISGGLQLSQWNGAGAFQWYSQIGESAEADRVMFRFAQSKPKDQDTTEIALGHFGVVNHPEALEELEKQAKTNPGDQQLQKKVGYLKEIQKTALKNIDEALVQEEKAYSKYNSKETVLGQSPIDESLRHLSVARDWHNLFGDPKTNKAAERAEKRGDAMMQDDRPKPLTQAKAYYDLAKASAKIRKLTDRANRLGDDAAKRNEYATAVKYYEIGHSETGENEDKINEMQSHLEKETKRKEKAQEKALQETIKDERKQKDFKKGQEEMEKEFGF